MKNYDIDRSVYEKIQRFTLMNDVFMSKVFEDKKCAELLLKIILQKDLTVISAVSQYSLKNLQGRSVRLDIYAEDSSGTRYNIEVQQSDSGAVPKRARYNGSLIDADITEPGDDLNDLPECYVIFITEHDVLKGGLPLYTIERTIKELGGKNFNDGSHIIYVNGENRDNTALGKLMQDFFCARSEDMNYKELAERTGYFKNDNGGVRKMCDIMDEFLQEKIFEEKIDIALNLISEGDPLEKIAKVTGLPLDKVTELAERKPV